MTSRSGPIAGARLLVLGAGIFQVDVIGRARELGAHVITLDNVPQNPGHRLGHERVDCSTTDVGAVLEHARSLAIDGVTTAASDVAVTSVATVRTALDLPGAFDPEIASTLSTKSSFRAFQQRSGLPHPRFVADTDLAAIESECSAGAFEYPLLAKPADSSGSRGVTRVASPRSLGAALERAASYSRAGMVLVEERIRGTEFGGDAFLRGGGLAHLTVTDKYLDGFAVAGHYVESGHHPCVADRVGDSLRELCAALGYTDGPLNFDVMVDGDQATLIEASPRTGGNGIPAVIRRATGFDTDAHVIHQALGHHGPADPAPLRGASGSVVLGSPHAGRIGRLPTLEEVQSAVPQVWDIRWSVAPGTAVRPMIDSNGMLGVALVDCADRAEYERVATALRTWIGGEVVGAG